MKYVCVLGAVLFPTAVSADIGHLGEVAGHDHLWALIGLGLAGIGSLIGISLGKDEDDETSSEDEAEASEDSAPQGA